MHTVICQCQHGWGFARHLFTHPGQFTSYSGGCWPTVYLNVHGYLRLHFLSYFFPNQSSEKWENHMQISALLITDTVSLSTHASSKLYIMVCHYTHYTTLQYMHTPLFANEQSASTVTVIKHTPIPQRKSTQPPSFVQCMYYLPMPTPCEIPHTPPPPPPVLSPHANSL